jgi:hypothetical protein
MNKGGGGTAPFPPKIILVPGFCPLLYSVLSHCGSDNEQQFTEVLFVVQVAAC